MIDSSEFRRVMGHFSTGVAIVTARRHDGSPCGLTVNAFCSVSLTPPLVLVCVEHGADSHACIVDSGAFAVNVLEETHGETISRRFATWNLEDKFAGIAFRSEKTTSPVLDAALAWIDCRVTETVRAGDHTIFLGEVLAAETLEGRPLVYYRGGYGRFTP